MGFSYFAEVSFEMMESFLTTSLESSNRFNYFIGITALYFNDFLGIYLSPILVKFFAIAYKVVFSPSPSSSSEHSDQFDEDALSDSQNRKEMASEIIKEQYRSLVDDRQAAGGSTNDIYMLKTFGYDKYRHASKDFLTRNRLAPSSSKQKKPKKPKK